MSTGHVSGSPRCQSCGKPVTHQYARVFGDNNDEVHGCIHCETNREMANGAGVQ